MTHLTKRLKLDSKWLGIFFWGGEGVITDACYDSQTSQVTGWWLMSDSRLVLSEQPIPGSLRVRHRVCCGAPLLAALLPIHAAGEGNNATRCCMRIPLPQLWGIPLNPAPSPASGKNYHMWSVHIRILEQGPPVLYVHVWVLVGGKCRAPSGL